MCDYVTEVQNLTLRHHCRHFHLHTRPYKHLIQTFNMHWMFGWPDVQVVCKCANEDVRFGSVESDTETSLGKWGITTTFEYQLKVCIEW